MMAGSSDQRPVFLYDGTCGFCKRWVARWKSIVGEEVEFTPFQDQRDRVPNIPEEELRRAAHYIHVDGTIHKGASAIYRMLSHSSRPSWKWRAYTCVPGFSAVAEAFYQFIARHRDVADVVTRVLWGRDMSYPRYTQTASVFMRGLAAIYLIAFVSLWIQLDGLIGREGILPAGPYMETIYNQAGAGAYWKVPSLSLFNSSDTFLHVQCALGVAASVALLMGYLPTLTAFATWLLYLSLTIAGQTFLGFQWENLLLETGLLAVFLFPPVWRIRGVAPSRLMLFALRFLLFKLMFASGVVKISSGDKSWWPDLTALAYHYETTCIPSFLNWSVHHMPLWFHKLSCVGMFVVELCVPFLIFLPRKCRMVAFLGLAGLQVVILTTGNYAYFNVLTLVLCIVVLDDAIWPVSKLPSIGKREPRSAKVWNWVAVIPVASVSVLLSAFIMIHQFDRMLGRYGKSMHISRPDWITVLHKGIGPFRSVNGYGLFAHMTKDRPEIIVEGSADGQEWKTYDFKWKPGDPSRMPSQVAPHQPRLDWQMWFAALQDYRQNQWFINFLARLLEGSEPVLDLIETNPFPDKPPRFIRATKYDYRFSDPAIREEEGVWWVRKRIGFYCPVLELREDGKLTAYQIK